MAAVYALTPNCSHIIYPYAEHHIHEGLAQHRANKNKALNIYKDRWTLSEVVRNRWDSRNDDFEK